MVGLDEFLSFLIEHKDDNRITISKKMKYGYRHYYLTLSVDEEPKKDNNHPSTFRYRFSESLDICIDNRNKCIEILYDNGSSNILVEDSTLVDKWSQIIDDLLNENLESNLKCVIENTLSSCYNKNLHREYQMRKIFPEQ